MPRKAFKRGVVGGTPAPAVFPPLLALPAATKTIAPATADTGIQAGAITANELYTKRNTFLYGDVIAAADGNYNRYARGPDTDAGGYYEFLAPAPGSYAGSPIIVRPTNRGGAKFTRLYVWSDRYLEFWETIFSDELGGVKEMMDWRFANQQPAPPAQPLTMATIRNNRPALLYIGANSIRPIIRSGQFIGNLSASPDDNPDLVGGQGAEFYNTLFQGGRNCATGRHSTVRGCFDVDANDRRWCSFAGTGLDFQDNVFFEPGLRATNAHVDVIQHTSGDNQSRVTPDVIRRNLIARGAVPTSQTAIFHQDTNTYSSGTVSNREISSNLVLGGEQDECVNRYLRSSVIAGNTFITDLGNGIAGDPYGFIGNLFPGLTMYGCQGTDVSLNIWERCVDNALNETTPNAAGVNALADNLWIDRTLLSGQTRNDVFQGSAITYVSLFDVFVDPAFGAAAYAGVSRLNRAGLLREYRRRFRVKDNALGRVQSGPNAGKIRGAVNPDGTWSDRTVYTGGTALAI